jgi:beta-fructofuranosidase
VPDAADPHRPICHLTAPGYCNDPNGLIHWQGRYHCFYQYHPDAVPSAWWRKHWGHASSADLAHWTHHPLALSPGPHPGDAAGCWSGCAIADGGAVHAFYTGLQTLPGGGWRQTLCRATAVDGSLEHWRKEAETLPISGLVQPPTATCRDPMVWRSRQGWRQVLAAEHDGCESIVLLGSDDLRSWDLIAPWTVLDNPDLGQPYSLYECPNAVTLSAPDGEERLVLIAGQQLTWGTYAWIGRQLGDRFVHGRWQALAPMSRLYGAQVLREPGGRCLLLGYVEEARDEAAIRRAGWCNVLSSPLVLGLDARGRITTVFAPELAALRGAERPIPAGSLGGVRSLPGIAGPALELDLLIDPGQAETVAVDVRAAPDGREFTRILWDRTGKRLTVETPAASLDPATRDDGGNRRRSPAAHQWFDPPAGPLRLQIVVDHSLVEVCADGRYVNGRTYPSLPASSGVRVAAHGAGACLLSGTAWELQRGCPPPPPA